MELAFAALQQLCAPLFDRLDRLPAPQRDALGVAFGLRAGDAPARFLVGLAVLSLFSEGRTSGHFCAWLTMRNGLIDPRRRRLCSRHAGCWRSPAHCFGYRPFRESRSKATATARTERGFHSHRLHQWLIALFRSSREPAASPEVISGLPALTCLSARPT